MTPQNYIAPLDGLRAVSVTLVLLFHVGINEVQGGFVGVDVFFVISGFIITKNILRDLDRNEFSFGSFLKKRVFRLLPALIATIAITSVAALFLLSPDQLMDYARSGAASLLWVANIFFYLSSDYFDGDSSSKPLLHTWSLSVEEQFYLFWPLVLWALYMIYRGRGILIGVSGLLALGLILSLYMATLDSSAAFYLTPFRVFQFAAGAVVAASGFVLYGRPAAFATLTGSIGIIAIAVIATGTKAYAIEAVAPTFFGAAFLIGMASTPARSFFGSSIMTYVGRRAYSIYLVHWPLIVLSAPYLSDAGTVSKATLWIIASLLLGILLYGLVESRFRITASPSDQGKSILHPLGFQSAVLSVLALFWWNSGFIDWHSPDVVALVKNAKDEREEMAKISQLGICVLTPKMPLESFNEDKCLTLDATKRNVAVLGDSFGIETIVGLRELAHNTDIAFSSASYAGCSPIAGSGLAALSSDCQIFNARRIAAVKGRSYDAVVLTGNWNAMRLEPLAELVRDLTNSGRATFVVGVRASFSENVADFLVKSGSASEANQNLASILLANRHSLNGQFRSAVTEAGGTYLEVLSTQCSTIRCNAVTADGDSLVYYDNHHLTRAGARILGDVIWPALRAPPQVLNLSSY